MITAKASLKRDDVPVEQTWNRESLFGSWEAFQEELDSISASLPGLEKYAGKLTGSPRAVVDWLEAYSQVRRRFGKLFVFVRMATAVDTNDVEAKAKMGQVMGLSSKINATAAFAEPELLTIGDILLDWAKSESDLTIFTHYFEDLLRQQAYTLSPEVEKVLGMLQDPFSGAFQTYKQLTDTDLKFPDALDSDGQSHRVTQAIIAPIGIQSSDRMLRQNAWESFCDEHRAVENTLASNLITSAKQHVFLARVRGYGSVLESRLAPSNLPVEVFHNLVDTFRANLPVWHRYWAAKRKALRVEKMQPFDIWAPMVEDEPEITYQQSVDWLCNALDPLGDEYVRTLRRGALVERWVDYAQNEGRGQGAFSNASHGGSYPFVFSTFDCRVGAMSVLAHELGHSMHSYLTGQNQPEIYNGFGSRGASPAVAETASNFHQAMLRAYLREAKADDKNFQLALIDEAMLIFHRYFFTMPNLARFELEVYGRAERDQPLNAAILNEVIGDIYAEGYGDTMVDDPDRTATTWGQFLHLYVPYFSFQYSVGISAAHGLADRILAGNDGVVDNYLSMLKAGWSRYAPDLFTLAGIDMTQPETVTKTFSVMEALVEQLETFVEGSILHTPASSI